MILSTSGGPRFCVQRGARSCSKRLPAACTVAVALVTTLLCPAPSPAASPAGPPRCRLDLAKTTLNVECLPAVSADGQTVAVVIFGEASFSVRFLGVTGNRAAGPTFATKLGDDRLLRRQVRAINQVLTSGDYRSLEAVPIAKFGQETRLHGLSLRVVDEGEQGVEIRRGGRLLGGWKPPEPAEPEGSRSARPIVTNLLLPGNDAFVLVESRLRDEEGQLVPGAPTFAIIRLPPGAPRHLPIPQQLCSARVAALRRWLQQLDGDAKRTPGRFPGQLGVRMVEHSGRTPAPAPIIELGPDQVGMVGGLFTEVSGEARSLAERLAAVGQALAIEANNHELLHPGELRTRAVAIAVDREVPWESIVALTRVIPRASYDRIDWLFATAVPPGQMPQPKSPIDGELAATRVLDPSRKATMLGEIAGDLFADCERGAKVFEGLGALPPEMRLTFLIDELPSAMPACGCAVDPSSLEALFYAVWGMPSSAKTYSAVSMRLAPDDAKSSRPLSAPARAPWSTTYRLAIDAATKPEAAVLRVTEE
jgi:hypothetical protein